MPPPKPTPLVKDLTDSVYLSCSIEQVGRDALKLTDLINTFTPEDLQYVRDTLNRCSQEYDSWKRDFARSILIAVRQKFGA